MRASKYAIAGFRLQSFNAFQSQRRHKLFEGLFQPMHMLVVFGIALLVFGPKKLPELGKGLGESIRGFKSAMAAKEEAKAALTKSDSITPNPPAAG
jgi:sec-independent protein translocase protein TatA